MSFTNLTPDTNPDGTPLTKPGVASSGLRYFYFTFTPIAPSIDVYLSRNIFRNEEAITNLTASSAPNISLMTPAYITSVAGPTTFQNGAIGLNIPAGVGYANMSATPNFRIAGLVPGTVYTLETRTNYNDRGGDFGAQFRNASIVLTLTYARSSTTTVALPPPPPAPTPAPTEPIAPVGVPAVPTVLSATPTQSGVNLTWNPSIGASSYKVYRSGNVLGTATTTGFLDSHVISGNAYTYSVAAVNSAGESNTSVTVTATPVFEFTSLVPDRTPAGTLITGAGIRYYYYLFTPITPAVDVYLSYNGKASEEAFVGLYDTTAPNANLLSLGSTLSNLDGNVMYGVFTLGAAPNPTLATSGVRCTFNGPYSNPGSKANFRLENLTAGNLDTPDAVLKTYILEVVSVKNDTDAPQPDLGAYMKNVGNSVHAGSRTHLVYHSSSPIRIVPNPYVLAYDFSSTSPANYTRYVFPYLYVFQNAKNLFESIVVASPGARLQRRANDMLVQFGVSALGAGTVGQSMLGGWTVDVNRSPDFTYQQEISFSDGFFANGYLTGSAKFNGVGTVNGRPNLSLFNVLVHEILHGMGIFYIPLFNLQNNNVGWSPFLTDVANNDPWYRGASDSNSSVLQAYRAYCGNMLLQRVPVEKDYGEGTALSHWDEGNAPDVATQHRYFGGIYHPSLKYEVMTGFTNNNDFFTGLTAGALKDYGYTVNLNSPYICHYPSNLIPGPPGAAVRAIEDDDGVHLRCMRSVQGNSYVHALKYCSSMMVQCQSSMMIHCQSTMMN